MYISKKNQMYKPQRMLYYMDTTDADIKAYYDGKVDEKIASYSNAFGTYDYPGLFYVASLNKEVIGIEYRIGDDRINYPQGLKTVELDAAFFYSVEIDYEGELTRETIVNLFAHIEEAGDAHRNYSDLVREENPEVISVFYGDSKVRVLHEWKMINDGARLELEDYRDGNSLEELYRKAFTDPITGHYNWNYLVNYLEMPMEKGINDYAFVHFDVKEFRVINEMYGHTVANKVLRNIVDAMNKADFVYASARCHNDNFAMMIKDMPQEETVEKLRSFFDNLSHLEEDPHYRIYYRCGVVLMQKSMQFGNRVADAGKMAQAMGKHQNQTDITIYTDKMHDDIMWGNYIKAYLDTAIENNEFLVYLQPKFDIRKESLTGAEALIRWNFKGKEMFSPYRFIPFFEKDGSIAKVDDIVLREVCKKLAKWTEEGKNTVPVSINLSRNRMYDANLVEHLTEIVDSYNVDHGLIDFELTESASYDNTDYMVKILTELKEQGFKISMDDFGTGYSSLSLLTSMPLNTLKIDKSFVDKIGTEDEKEKDLIVLENIISLAHRLGIICLAEGAETAPQVDRLRELGCEIVQGYYYSKPIPMEEFEEKYER